MKIVDVKYPANIPDFYGILELQNDSKLLFIPSDKRYPTMIVAEISDEAFDKIYADDSNEFSLFF